MIFTGLSIAYFFGEVKRILPPQTVGVRLHCRRELRFPTLFYISDSRRFSISPIPDAFLYLRFPTLFYISDSRRFSISPIPNAFLYLRFRRFSISPIPDAFLYLRFPTLFYISDSRRFSISPIPDAFLYLRFPTSYSISYLQRQYG